jgi:hypothetical protein
MVWVIVERVVHLFTLVLLIVMLSIIFTNNKASQDSLHFETKLSQYKEENQTVRNNNIAYIEKRINKLQEQQDNYQILVDRRLLIMESQVRILSDSNKSNQKVVQTNINNNLMGSPNILLSK